MTAQRIKTVSWLITDNSGKQYRIDFIPATGTPDFTHRIAVNNQLQSGKGFWLSKSFKPDSQAAKFFLQSYLTAELECAV